MIERGIAPSMTVGRRVGYRHRPCGVEVWQRTGEDHACPSCGAQMELVEDASRVGADESGAA